MDGNGPGNWKSIGTEICESGNRAKTLQNAVELVADLLKQRGWGVDRLRRHFDWSGKDCPRILRENNWAGWEKFKQDVQKEVLKMTTPTQPTVPAGMLHQPDAWAVKARDWAVSVGITDGTRPRDSVTRQEAWSMLMRLAERK